MVYSITSKVSKRKYYGSTVYRNRRWSEHVAMLVKGTHHSRSLQEDVDKHGLLSIVFDVAIPNGTDRDELDCILRYQTPVYGYNSWHEVRILSNRYNLPIPFEANAVLAPLPTPILRVRNEDTLFHLSVALSIVFGDVPPSEPSWKAAWKWLHEIHRTHCDSPELITPIRKQSHTNLYLGGKMVKVASGPASDWK